MAGAFENEIRDMMANGNKIAAIKRYREETGAGLAEAKAAVESLVAGESLPTPNPIDSAELTAEVVSLLGRGEENQAIKLCREQRRGSLKEARKAVAQIAAQNGIPLSSGIGCLGVILPVAGVVGVFC